MRSIGTKAVATLAAGLLIVMGSACGGGDGACDSTGRYCGDDYSKDECDERNELEVNGESWFHHPGQTCAERGKDSTS